MLDQIRIDANGEDIHILDMINMRWVNHKSILIDNDLKYMKPHTIWIDFTGINFINYNNEYRRVPAIDDNFNTNIQKSIKTKDTYVNLNPLYLHYISLLSMTKKSYRVLCYLFTIIDTDNPISQRTISESIDMNKTDVSISIKELDRYGLLVKPITRSRNRLFKLTEFSDEQLRNMISNLNK